MYETMDKTVVLIVEDDVEWRDILARVVRKAGYTCASASSSAEGLLLLQRLSPTALVLDMVLGPGVVDQIGWESWNLARQAELQGISSIIVTGYADVEVARRAFKEFGVVDIFDKGDFAEQAASFLRTIAQAAESTLKRRRQVRLSPLLDGLRAAWSAADQNLNSPTEFETAIEKVLGLAFGEIASGYSKIPFHNDSFVAFCLDTKGVFGELHLLNHLPVVFCRERNFSEVEFTVLRELLAAVQAGSRPQKIALLIAFTDAVSSGEIQRLIERFRIYAYDIILLPFEALEGILTAEYPTLALRRFVLSQVDLRSVSPFIVGGPTDDTVFFGREQELRDIGEHLHSASYAVIGGRRIGKSSLLGRLHRIVLPSAGFRTLYHDCSETLDPAAFLAATVTDETLAEPDSPAATFGDILEAPSSEQPLGILLDEVDGLLLTDGAHGWKLFQRLRAVANSRRAQFVLTGERILREAMRDSNSPLFNFTNRIVLGPLDHRAVEELVTRPMKELNIDLVDQSSIVGRVWSFSSGHPYIVQCLCKRLIERLNERRSRQITPDDVAAVVQDPAFQSDDFLNTFWERATTIEKIVSLLMVRDRRIRTLSDIRSAVKDFCGLDPGAREIDGALQRLVDLRFILRSTATGYEFSAEAFPRVVTGTITLDHMLEVLTEEFRER